MFKRAITRGKRSFIINTDIDRQRGSRQLDIGVPGYQRREDTNDSRPTWLELRKFRSTATTPSRKSKYRLRTRKSIPAQNIYRQRVAPVTRSFDGIMKFSPRKIGSHACEFLSFRRFHFLIDTFAIWLRCDRDTLNCVGERNIHTRWN